MPRHSERLDQRGNIVWDLFAIKLDQFARIRHHILREPSVRKSQSSESQVLAHVVVAILARRTLLLASRGRVFKPIPVQTGASHLYDYTVSHLKVGHIGSNLHNLGTHLVSHHVRVWLVGNSMVFALLGKKRWSALVLVQVRTADSAIVDLEFDICT